MRKYDNVKEKEKAIIKSGSVLWSIVDVSHNTSSNSILTVKKE